MDNVSEKFSDVASYILSEEEAYKTRPIPLASNWEWSMYEHIDKSFQLKNSQFTKGANDFTRPFNNVIIPIANVNYRAEGFDIKDVNLTVSNKDNYHKSFLTRFFHDRWARKFSIDTAVDESVESYFDYGLALAKNVNEERPEIVPLQQIAFCDQTDVLSGPICLKHQYSIDHLLDMKGKWYEDEIDRAIRNSRFAQQRVADRETRTPGKYVEVYELHGVFPKSWLTDNYTQEDTGVYSRQIHIYTFYTDATTGQKNGICLFRGNQPKQVFKALKRDDIYGRACGRGGIEELFHPQTWTNYAEIHLQQMLEAVSKVVLKTNDKQVAQNNNLKKLKHNQIISLQENTDINQLLITAPNKTAFENFTNKWEQIARTIGSASDPQLGLNPTSGTPLGTTEIVTQQGQGIHDYRKGKIALFWTEIYRDWSLGYIQRDILKGDEWMQEMSLDELRELAERVATNQTNKRVKEMLIEGRMVTREELEEIRAILKEDVLRRGSKQLLKILKDELKNLPLEIEINIANKQKVQAEMVAKLNAIWRSIFANPAILQVDGATELLNQILEAAGLSPLSFTSLTQMKAQPVDNQPLPQQSEPVPA